MDFQILPKCWMMSKKYSKYLKMINIDDNLETDKPDENTAKNANNE